jgi:hypothetical protein
MKTLHQSRWDMKNARTALIFSLVTLAVLGGCNPPAPKTQGEGKPAEAKPAFQPTFLTGREALQQMYIAAHGWAPDAKPYNLKSIATKEANGQNGKSGIWSAGFASATRRTVKTFSWSGIKTDDAPEPGISNRPEDTYNPANTSTAVFELAFLKVDSDEALEVAQKHGADKLLKKAPDTNIVYALSWNPRENKLVWRVLLGDEASEPKLAVDVDATTRAFMKTEK